MVSREQFEQFKRATEEALVATQADVDALTGQVGGLATILGSVQADLAASTAAIQQEIQQLQSGLDLTALQAAVEPLAGMAQQIDDAVKALNPAPPAPVEEPAVEQPAS